MTSGRVPPDASIGLKGAGSGLNLTRGYALIFTYSPQMLRLLGFALNFNV